MTDKPRARKILSEERIELEIKHKTHFAKSYAQRAMKNVDELRRDARRTDRLKAHECKTCFYLRSSRVGGHELNTAPCKICGKAMHFGTTVVTDICEACAAEHEICKMCMSDMELRLD